MRKLIARLGLALMALLVSCSPSGPRSGSPDVPSSPAKVSPSPSASPLPTRTCEQAISVPHPGPRPGVGRILLGRVWIPSAPSEVLHPSHPRTPGGNLFFKQGISVRAGTPIELVVPNAFRGDVSVDFAAGPVPGASSLGEGENAIFVEPCPADSQGPWTAFSGGFLSRRLICAALVVRVEGRTERLPIGLGKRCWKTGRAMFQALTETLQVTFNDSVTPPTATWKDVSPLLTSVDTLDPILFTDPATGRTFVSQLYLACSLMAFSDDDGGTWIQNPLGCGPGAAVDHQTVGGGPFAPPLSNPVYPHAVYYCAQAIAEAACAESVTGGATFGPGVPMYTLFACGGPPRPHQGRAGRRTCRTRTAVASRGSRCPPTTGPRGTCAPFRTAPRRTRATNRSASPPTGPCTSATRTGTVTPGSRCPGTRASAGAPPWTSECPSASRTPSSRRWWPATATGRPSPSSGPRPPGTTRAPGSPESGTSTWRTRMTGASHGLPSTPRRTIPCSVDASGWAAAATRAETSSTSWTPPSTRKGGCWWDSPTAALAPA